MPLVHAAAIDPPSPGGVALLLHGGAWDIPDDVLEEHRDGLQQALARGRSLLLEGAASLDVVAETVSVMEAHGAFDAGRGSVLNLDGEVELDAGLMDGATLDYGAVIGVRHVLHPIRLAKTLLERGEHEARILAGEGAERFAAQVGVKLIPPDSLIHPRERQHYEALLAERGFQPSHNFQPRGTVGCVARDRNGRLAVATSTGGTPLKPAGRVGDSPIPGAGFYSSEHGAASSTGWGEAILAVMLAGRAVDAIGAGTAPEDAARAGLTLLHERIRNAHGEGGAAGMILMGRSGAGAWAYTTPRMARAGWKEGSDPWVTV